MVSLILHFRNGMGANSAVEQVTEYFKPKYRHHRSTEDNEATCEVKYDEDKVTIRKSWNRVTYRPNLDDETKFFDEEQLKHLTRIMIESDTHFPERVWTMEICDYQSPYHTGIG